MVVLASSVAWRPASGSVWRRRHRVQQESRSPRLRGWQQEEAWYEGTRSDWHERHEERWPHDLPPHEHHRYHGEHEEPRQKQQQPWQYGEDWSWQQAYREQQPGHYRV